MTQSFARVTVDNLIQGGARVSWEIERHFVDPGSYDFQLQIGHTGLDEADDWTDVGSPVVDTYYAFDLEKRAYGKTLDTHYRVELTTTSGTYYSRPAPSDGLLSKKDWLIAREIVRNEQLRHSALTSVKGFLVKARRYGPRCLSCTDPLTEEVSQSQCQDCYGTGFDLGYFEPLPTYFCDIGLEQNREHRNPQTGMEKQDVVKARFVGDTQLYSYDVWINEFSDERYYMHTIGSVANVRGVPLVFDVELRLAPYTDVIYTLPLTKDSIPDPPGRTKTWEKREAPPRSPGLTYLEATLNDLKSRKRR